MRIVKTKLLFALASEQNFFTRGEGYEYKPYEYLYFRLSEFEKGSVRDAAVRLASGGELDKIVRGKTPQFRLTALGRERLLNKLNIYRGQRKVWDRIWRLVIVSGVGKSVRVMAGKLARLGYKRVARGVYITPLPVSSQTRRLFLQKTWTKRVQVIESRRLIFGDDIELARRLWKLDLQAEKYADFVKRSESLLKMARKNLMLLRQSKGGFKQVFDGYFNLLLVDPGLPKKLLPPDWQSDKAKELFLRLVELTKTAKI